MKEDFFDEFEGQRVCLREFLNDDYEYEGGFYIYRYRTDLFYNKLDAWETEFLPYRYTETPFDTAPFNQELVRYYEKFLEMYKKRSLSYQGRVGALEARHITDLIWILKYISNDFSVEAYEGANGFTNINIRVPSRVNTVLTRLAKYTNYNNHNIFKEIGTTILKTYENALFEMYEDPYQEYSPSEILEMAAERYQDCY